MIEPAYIVIWYISTGVSMLTGLMLVLHHMGHSYSVSPHKALVLILIWPLVVVAILGGLNDG